jgi:hypothetical protein
MPLIVLSRQVRALGHFHETSDKRGPAGLVTGAKTSAVPVKVLVKENQV